MGSETVLPRNTSRWFSFDAVALMHALLAGCVLYAGLCLCVSHTFLGDWFGPLMFGTRLGIPDSETARGIRPTTQDGWDGQFYYRIANDLLARQGTAPYIDCPPYRYQRIGVPAIAWGATRLMGQTVITPHTYLVVHLLLMLVGLVVLIGWLRERGWSAGWAYAWLLSAGVLNAGLHGLPDPAGDAMFIVCLVSLLRGRVLAYSLSAALLVLIREGYFAIIAPITLLTVFGHLHWSAARPGRVWQWIGQRLDCRGTSGAGAACRTAHAGSNPPNQGSNAGPLAWATAAFKTIVRGPHPVDLRTVAAVLLPCLVFAGWQAHIRAQFGASGSEAAGNVLLDYPLAAYFKSMYTGFKTQSRSEFVLRLEALAILAAGFAALWEVRRELPLIWIAGPYLALLCLMSTLVWNEWTGFLKAMGSVLVLLVVLLPWCGQRRSLRWLLIIVMLHGPYQLVRVKKGTVFPPISLQAGTPAVATGGHQTSHR